MVTKQNDNAQHIIGIDLGTTNCVLASTANLAPEQGQTVIDLFSIPQLVNPNEVAEQKTLPSFLFLPGEFDFPAGSLSLAWPHDESRVVGELARKRGAENPTRFVASAKSWLCN